MNQYNYKIIYLIIVENDRNVPVYQNKEIKEKNGENKKMKLPKLKSTILIFVKFKRIQSKSLSVISIEDTETNDYTIFFYVIALLDCDNFQ